jgi:hypothetical protein
MKNMRPSLLALTIAGTFLFTIFWTAPLSGETVIEAWDEVKVPPAPEVKAV